MKLLFLILVYIPCAIAASDDCQMFKYCRGGGGGSSNSSPSNASSGGLNPSNISDFEGYGLEAIYQPSNPVFFDVVTGNGKIGALISPNLDNSFFGNRTLEIDDLNLYRQVNKKQYKNKKLNFGLGAKIVNKKNFGIDIGFSVKHNPDTQNNNPGFGASLKLGPLRFGAYVFKDDIKLNLGSYIDPYSGLSYSSIYSSSTYQEKYTVQTLTAGLKFRSFTFDAGYISTQYSFYRLPTKIKIYSASYALNNFLLSYGMRQESSMNLKYQDSKIFIQYDKSYQYYGLQYLANKHVVFGVQYNYFLLNEVSFMLTFFI